MFYNCDRRNNRDEVKQQMADQSETSTNSENTTPAENMPVLTPTNDAGNTNGEIRENNINGESSNDIADHGNLEEMEIEKWAPGFKRQFAVDSSDSDSKAPPRPQRNPAPNVKNSGKQRDKSMAGKQQHEYIFIRTHNGLVDYILIIYYNLNDDCCKHKLPRA